MSKRTLSVCHTYYRVESDEVECWRADEDSRFDEIDCTPDEWDREDGLATAVHVAAKHLRSDDITEPSGTPGYPGPGCWYSAEPFTVDYGTGEECEITAHRGDGWTDEEWRSLWELVTAKG